MKWDEIDTKYSEYVNSKESLWVDDEQDMDQIWAKVRPKKEGRKLNVAFWYAAASILLILAASGLYALKLNKKNDEINQLQAELSILKNKSASSNPQKFARNEHVNNLQPTIKTIYKTRIVYLRPNIAPEVGNKNTSSMIATESKDTMKDSFKLSNNKTIAVFTDSSKRPSNSKPDIIAINDLEKMLPAGTSFRYLIKYGDIEPGQEDAERSWELIMTAQ